jgi:hypothetical protein
MEVSETMTRETYTLDVHREGAWWIIDAPAVDYRTQARTLSEVEEMGRDLLAGALDRSPDSFDIDVHIETPADVTAKLDEAAGLEQEARNTQALAAFQRRVAARTLHDTYGLSAIDAARVLGVSRARVYQLLEEKASA